MKKKCPKCGSIEESKFCTKCGQNLTGPDIVKICPTCGAEVTSRFCVYCGTKMDQEDAAEKKQSMDTQAVPVDDEAKQKEEEEKRRLAQQKEEEEKRRIVQQKEEEEKRRIAQQKEEEEKRRIAQQKEEEERKRKEELQKSINNRKKYEEAISYMESAEQADDKHVAAEFYRKAEAIFDHLLGWENSEEKSFECSRKAKACEIAIESEAIAEKKAMQAASVSNSITETEPVKEETVIEAAPADTEKEPVKEKAKVTKPKPKSKTLLIAVLIGAVAIAGILFALTHNKSGSAENTSAETTEESGENIEPASGDLIELDEKIELEWDAGKVVLTHYQLEKTEEDGDVVNLYFDYQKTGGEQESFTSAIETDVFQNGYELDEKTFTTVDAENNAFNDLKTGASITAARGFILNDSSELSVVLTAYDKDYNEVVKKTSITIPDDAAADITGSKKYFEDTGETSIKDGKSVKTTEGELKLTGYKWTEYEGEEFLIVYYDYTNLLDKESSLADSNFYSKVFQNGVEQDNSGWATTEAENHFFARVQKGTTIHCGRSYQLNDKSDIEVELVGYTDDDEVKEEQTVKVK